MSDMIVLTELDLVNNKMMTMAEIVKFARLTDKWFYQLIKDGKFPKPIKIGRKSFWLESEVLAWLNARIIESRG